MLFVVDKPRLQRMLTIVRDDRKRGARAKKSPYMRIEASENQLTLTGKMVAATFPVTVHEPGVLFLRVTIFRKMLKLMPIKEVGTRFLTIQANSDGLVFGDVRMSFEFADMLLYPDPTNAPETHPEDRLTYDKDQRDEVDPNEDDQGENRQGMLF